MRLHRLEMTAFGPYADTQTVDFDELNDAGIFLLTGPTGAGKTSILDAICFAFYGLVPGVRDVKTLRSHHAAEGVAPEVVLEATIGDRRVRVRRSPEWHRPKKRGDGTTREHACASLTVIEDDGTERLVSSRIAEVGHELTMAIGMSSEQFMQVAMLPQGDFQRFLQATSDERQGVLEKLFRTQRFTRIEAWMKDRTRELGERAGQAERHVCQLLATIANRADTSLPDVLDEERLGDVAPVARSWAGDALSSATAEHSEAAQAERAAHATLEQLRSEEQLAVQLTATLKKQTDARRVLDDLAESAEHAEHERLELARHEAALRVRPLLELLEELQCSAAEAARARDAALAKAAGLPVELRPEPLDHARCTASVQALTDRAAALRAVLPREAALQRAGTKMQAALGARDEHRADLDALAQRAEVLPGERQEVRRLLAENQLLAHRIGDVEAELRKATDQHEAAMQLPAAQSAHRTLTEQHLQARELAATARERHLDVVGRRLAGMAAELAGQLVDGEPCQVCGSADHPAPAQLAAGAVGEEDQELAAAEADLMRRKVDRLAGEVAEASRVLHSLETLADGLTAEEAATRLDGCRAAVTAAETALTTAADLEQRASELDREHDEVSGRLQELRELIAAQDSAIAALKTTFEEAAREVAAAVGPGGGPVEQVIAELQDALDLVQEVASALELHQSGEARLTEALAQADAEAQRQGFDSAAQAAEALLDERAAEAQRDRLQLRDGRHAAASAALVETSELLEGTDVPDLGAARARLAAATDEWRRASGLVGSLEQCTTSLALLVEQLDEALLVWEPAREEHATAEGMSKLVRGMGGDNQLQMRLSSYVLATRLDQVLDAANERLSQMRDQRYTLRRCGRTRGGARAGLGLEVLDTWTGEARAPSTLSGGETFVVSLALALGLADVVAQESGGTRVDTLFIDEGFGMLDPETLDDVMDRIDALRAGGRTVGVVSHVTELRGRIPTQLHVDRGQSGSRVAVRTLVA